MKLKSTVYAILRLGNQEKYRKLSAGTELTKSTVRGEPVVRVTKGSHKDWWFVASNEWLKENTKQGL